MHNLFWQRSPQQWQSDTQFPEMASVVLLTEVAVSGERVSVVQTTASGPRSVGSRVFRYKFLPHADAGPFPGFSGPLAICRSSTKFLFCFNKPEFIFCGLKLKRPTDVAYVLLMYKNNENIHYDIVFRRRILETT